MLLTRSRRRWCSGCQHELHRSGKKMDDDPIKAFLETSGLTAEDLIRRLTRYQTAVEEEIVHVKREPGSPERPSIPITDTILISDDDDDEEEDVRREPDPNLLKRRLEGDVDDEEVPRKSRRCSEEREFTWRSNELFEGKDLDTFILKNRLGDIFEDSPAWSTKATESRGQKSGSEIVNIDLVESDDTGDAINNTEEGNNDVNKVGTVTCNKLGDSGGFKQNKIQDEIPTGVVDVEGCCDARVSQKRTQDEHHKVLDVNELFDPQVPRKNRAQDEVVDVDEIDDSPVVSAACDPQVSLQKRTRDEILQEVVDVDSAEACGPLVSTQKQIQDEILEEVVDVDETNAMQALMEACDAKLSRLKSTEDEILEEVVDVDGTEACGSFVFTQKQTRDEILEEVVDVDSAEACGPLVCTQKQIQDEILEEVVDVDETNDMQTLMQACDAKSSRLKSTEDEILEEVVDVDSTEACGPLVFTQKQTRDEILEEVVDVDSAEACGPMVSTQKQIQDEILEEVVDVDENNAMQTVMEACDAKSSRQKSNQDELMEEVVDVDSAEACSPLVSTQKQVQDEILEAVVDVDETNDFQIITEANVSRENGLQDEILEEIVDIHKTNDIQKVMKACDPKFPRLKSTRDEILEEVVDADSTEACDPTVSTKKQTQEEILEEDEINDIQKVMKACDHKFPRLKSTQDKILEEVVNVDEIHNIQMATEVKVSRENRPQDEILEKIVDVHKTNDIQKVMEACDPKFSRRKSIQDEILEEVVDVDETNDVHMVTEAKVSTENRPQDKILEEIVDVEDTNDIQKVMEACDPKFPRQKPTPDEIMEELVDVDETNDIQMATEAKVSTENRHQDEILEEVVDVHKSNDIQKVMKACDPKFLRLKSTQDEILENVVNVKSTEPCDPMMSIQKQTQGKILEEVVDVEKNNDTQKVMEACDPGLNSIQDEILEEVVDVDETNDIQMVTEAMVSKKNGSQDEILEEVVDVDESNDGYIATEASDVKVQKSTEDKLLHHVDKTKDIQTLKESCDPKSSRQKSTQDEIMEGIDVGNPKVSPRKQIQDEEVDRTKENGTPSPKIRDKPGVARLEEAKTKYMSLEKVRTIAEETGLEKTTRVDQDSRCLDNESLLQFEEDKVEAIRTQVRLPSSSLSALEDKSNTPNDNVDVPAQKQIRDVLKDDCVDEVGLSKDKDRNLTANVDLTKDKDQNLIANVHLPNDKDRNSTANVDLTKDKDQNLTANRNKFEVAAVNNVDVVARELNDKSSFDSELLMIRDTEDSSSEVCGDSDGTGESSSDGNLPSPAGNDDAFDAENLESLRDPCVLKRELEEADAWRPEEFEFDGLSVVKVEDMTVETEQGSEDMDVDGKNDEGECNGGSDVCVTPDGCEKLGGNLMEVVEDRSKSPRENLMEDVEKTTREAIASNEEDCCDDGKEETSKKDHESVVGDQSGRSSPSWSTLELNSDLSDVDESQRPAEEADSSTASIEFVDAGPPCQTVDLTLLDEQEEHTSVAPDKKLPTVGTLVKGVGRRTARIFRPPWLKADDLNDVGAPDVAASDLPRQRKPGALLVDIRTTIPGTYHKRRTKMPPPSTPSLFDIKIVDVRSGVDVDADLRNAIAQIRNRRIKSEDDEEVKGDVIQVTKTSDPTKIKGWRRKNLLIKSETASSDDVEDPGTENVFASDNLDGFLDRQRNLNISYDVPNLESSNHSNVDYLDSTVIMHDSSTDEKGRFESRRRFTMAENEQVSCINQNAKTDPFKPRTLAEKRKLLSKEVKVESPSSHSLIYYRGKAFRIPTKYEKNVTVHGENRSKYRYTYTPIKPHKKAKPSIYKTIGGGGPPAIKYRPGPMSKKGVVESSDGRRWTAVVKRLPCVGLRVVPEYKRPLHPRAAQFVKFETFEVTAERLEFALGALPGKGAPTAFGVPYRNDQKTVLLLKAVAVEVKPLMPPKVEDENVDDVVRRMLDDMLDYVELKELGDSIVKEDHSYEPQAGDAGRSPVKPGPKKSARTEVIKGSTKKTNLELKRLNVKIIEVNIEDGADDVGCTKAHCRLGCVCKSLRTQMFPQDHCGKRQCVFGCVCGFEKSRNRRMKFVLPSGTDILSETTVSRLQDEAKKNLAKVEKEFTQTVIHANNQTIVVGEKTDRKRRPLKTPKKYEDYIEPVLGDEDDPKEPAVVVPKPIVVELPRKRKPPPPTPQQSVIPCRVVVQRLDLDHVIPLCLEHNLYDCHCNGTVEYTARPTPSTTPVVVEQNKEIVEKTVEKVESKKLIKEKKDKDYDYCARTRGTPNSIVQRNRTIKYKKTLAVQLKRAENPDANALSYSARWLKEKDSVDAVVRQIELDNATVSNKEVEPENGKKKRRKVPALIPLREERPVQIEDDPFLEPLGTGSLESSKPTSRRKQVLMTREQMSEVMKKKALEEKAKAVEEKKQEEKQPPAPPPQPPQMLGEAVVPLHSDLNQKVKDLLGNNNDVLRIIPWRLLLQKYISKSIEIWCCPSFQKFVLTEPNVRLTSTWLNVRQHETDKTCGMYELDFFKWIAERRLPDETQSVSIILQKTTACWEIRGIVRKSNGERSLLRKNQPLPQAQPQSQPQPQPQAQPQPQHQPQPDEIAQKTQQYVGEVNSQYRPVPRLKIRMSKFKFQQLHGDEHGDYEVRLPHVEAGHRWRMLVVSNFSHLAFKRNSHRIKCTDIIVAMKQAQQFGRTAHFSNKYIGKNYAHKLFGVYACPFHLNKVFIGPYEANEDHDLETLRFVNNVLVNTEVVDKMRNADVQSNGCWFTQMPPKQSAALAAAAVTAAAAAATPPPPPPKAAATTFRTNEADYALLSTFDAATTMFTDTLRSLMNAARLRLPHNAVPLALKTNFDDGFIHAYKYPGRDAIHVYWPGSRLDEPHTFDTKDIALDCVTSNLKNTFITLPNFTITAKFAKVSDFVNNSSCSSLSRSYFDELHIVGPFGSVRMVDVANYLINPEKVYSQELLDIVKHFCLGSEGFTQTDFLESMLVQTKADVSVELSKSTQLSNERKELEKKRTELLTKFRALKPSSKTTNAAEVICLDSDDETDAGTKTTLASKTAPASKIVPTSKGEPSKKQAPPPTAPASFTKLSDAVDPAGNVKVQSNVVLYQMQGGAQLTRQTVVAAPSSRPKLPTIKSVRPMLPYAEKIDLSHLDPDKVRRLLGSKDLTSGKVVLTGEQLRSLRALSKVKVTATSTVVGDQADT